MSLSPHMTSSSRAQAVVERGVATARALGAYRDGESASRAHQDRELLRAGDAGVEEVALEHHPGAHGEGYDDGGVFAALGAVDRDRVGVGELVQFIEPVVDLLVFVGEDGERMVLGGSADHDADGAIEYTGGTRSA